MASLALGIITIIGVIILLFEIGTKGFKKDGHKVFFTVICTLTAVCGIAFIIFSLSPKGTDIKIGGDSTITGGDTNKSQTKKDSIKQPPTVTPTETPKQKCEYQEIDKDTYSISYQGANYGVIYIPSSLTEFFLYEQNGASGNPKDSREYIDINNKEVGYLSRDTFLCYLGKYISTANSRNMRLIISANDPEKNDWRGNLRMKYGKDKSSVVPFKRSSAYVHSDSKVIQIQGWINY